MASQVIFPHNSNQHSRNTPTYMLVVSGLILHFVHVVRGGHLCVTPEFSTNASLHADCIRRLCNDAKQKFGYVLFVKLACPQGPVKKNMGPRTLCPNCTHDRTATALEMPTPPMTRLSSFWPISKPSAQLTWELEHSQLRKSLCPLG